MKDDATLDSPFEAVPDSPRDASILELSLFLALAFLISWTLWFVALKMSGIGIRLVLFYKTLIFPWSPVFVTFGSMAPGISAVILTVASRRRYARMRDLLKSLASLRGSWAGTPSPF